MVADIPMEISHHEGLLFLSKDLPSPTIRYIAEKSCFLYGGLIDLVRRTVGNSRFYACCGIINMREGAMRYLEEAKYNSGTSKRLKEIRIANHYTQQEVADEMGIGLDYYKKLEAGKKNVQLLRLQKLADSKKLDMDVEYIAFGTSNQKNENGKDDIKKEFYRFISSHQKRETQLNEIILEYIGRIIRSAKGGN